MGGATDEGRGGHRPAWKRRRGGARQVAAQKALARDASQRRHDRGDEAARRDSLPGVARRSLRGGEDVVDVVDVVDVAARLRKRPRVVFECDDAIPRVRPRATRLVRLAPVVVRRARGRGALLNGNGRGLPGTGAFGLPRHRLGVRTLRRRWTSQRRGREKGPADSRVAEDLGGSSRARGCDTRATPPQTCASRRGTPARSVVRARADERNANARIVTRATWTRGSGHCFVHETRWRHRRCSRLSPAWRSRPAAPRAPPAHPVGSASPRSGARPTTRSRDASSRLSPRRRT